MAAFLTCNFFSKAINISTTMNVILPEGKSDRAYPTLYLLHGYSDNHAAWARWTSIERYAREYQLAVVMPDVQKSFYNDYPGIDSGYRYWTFVSEELIETTRRLFHLSDKREETFVAGLSMGGFGAFKCALNRPDVFSAAASFSGALDMAGALSDRDESAEMRMLFGPMKDLKGGPNDLFAAAERTAKLADKPRLYQHCGTEDFLYEGNARFRDHVQTLGYDYTYAESPGGHTWDVWDVQVEKFLAMLPLDKVQAEE